MREERREIHLLSLALKAPLEADKSKEPQKVQPCAVCTRMRGMSSLLPKMPILSPAQITNTPYHVQDKPKAQGSFPICHTDTIKISQAFNNLLGR